MSIRYLLSMLVLQLFASPVLGCDCNEPEPSVQQLFEDTSGLIFVGKVKTVSTSNKGVTHGSRTLYYQEVEIEILENFRTDSATTVTILNEGFSNCGFRLEAGGEYLFYAYHSEHLGAPFMMRCHKPVSKTNVPRIQKEVAELRRLKNGG